LKRNRVIHTSSSTQQNVKHKQSKIRFPDKWMHQGSLRWR